MACTNRIFNFVENGDILYRITLDSVLCTGTGENKQQTWRYIVEKISVSAQDISNWALELCPTVEVFNRGGGTVEDPNNSKGQAKGQCLKTGNCTNITPENPVNLQIKWDTSGGTFSFILEGCYECRESRVAIKAGNDCFCGTICGPSCEPGTCEPPTRGILFS
jgi:hypothetical protein